jgi:lipid II:glycine glycyltransferase (peptidoglycan interpeptide bridge formation enzyme)
MDFHVKTRNAIRKGQKLELHISIANTEDDWEWMLSVHQQSISKMGGLAKTPTAFNALKGVFGPEAQLWVGRHNGKRVTGLVVIYYRDTVEYFTPVVEDSYRDTQALSALIFEVMQRSSHDGCLYWNWGGTWKSQEGVYRFKKRWGAKDHPYRYFNYIVDESVLTHSRTELMSAFPNFYLYKFK